MIRRFPFPLAAPALRPWLLGLVLALAQYPSTDAVAQASATGTATFQPHSGQAGKDVVWVPTPQALVDRMLDMAGLTRDDYVVDLGSGDGRTVITAARRGARAHGIEYNPDMVALARRNAESEKVGQLATFAEGDIFKSDFSSATLITLFLLPDLNVRLRPILLDMKPGTRVVSNSFEMGDWEPDDRIDAGGSCTSWCRAYKWVIPAKVAGNWQLGDATLQLGQRYQMIDGSMRRGGNAVSITDARLNGAGISFVAGGQRYSGTVDGNTMSGTVEGGGNWRASRLAP